MYVNRSYFFYRSLIQYIYEAKDLIQAFFKYNDDKGIGPKNAKIIERLCGKYIVDLLFHKPAAYIDRRNSPKIIDLEEGSIATVVVKIDSHTPLSIEECHIELMSLMTAGKCQSSILIYEVHT